MPIQTLIGKKNIGELLGTGLGSGISKGLEELAERKLQNLQSQNIRSRLSSLTGVPVEGEADQVGTQVPGQEGGGIQSPRQPDLPLGTPAQEMEYGKELLRLQEGERNRRLKEKLATAARTEKQQTRIDAETFKAVEEWEKEAKSADIEIRELEEFKRLSEKGETGTQLGNALLKGGAALFFDDDKIPTDWVLSDDAQKQIKLSANFVKTAMQSITGRKSRELMRMLAKAYPNIWQSPEAQKYVADILLYEANLKKAKQVAARDITRENEGSRPRNIRELVDNRVKEKHEPELYQQFFPKETVLDTETEYEGLPKPFLTPKNAIFYEGKYAWKNTGSKWIKVGKNPDYKGK